MDPGSRAFENPEKWGYKFYARTLEEHRALLDSPSWKLTLSYETDLMTRDDIAETSYDAAKILAGCEYEAGRISETQYERRNERTETARALMHEVDAIMAVENREEREAELWNIREKGRRIMDSTVCEKSDLSWNAKPVWTDTFRIAKRLIFPLGRKTP